jgi:hypothetical protein
LCLIRFVGEKFEDTNSGYGVDDIDILGRLAEHEGPIAMSACIDERLNRSKKGQVKFALTGRSATGKTTFLNTIRTVSYHGDVEDLLINVPLYA